VGTLLVAQVVETLRHKPEGSGFDSRRGHLLNPSGRTMAMGSTQPLTEMSARVISWGGGKGGQCVGLTTFPLCADCLEILAASTSWSFKDLSRPA